MQKELQLKRNYAAIGEEITPALAASFVKSFAEAHPAEIASFHIGRNIIEHILSQPGCHGIHFYNAINEVGQKTLVYVGIDESGKDILKRTVVAEDGSLNIVSACVGDRSTSPSSTVWETIKTWLGF